MDRKQYRRRERWMKRFVNAHAADLVEVLTKMADEIDVGKVDTTELRKIVAELKTHLAN